MRCDYTQEEYQTKLKLYRNKVKSITQKQQLKTLTDYDKRGKGQYHLDHIISIVYGFNNNIDPEIIGNIKNLQYLPYKTNIKKRDYLTKDSWDIIVELIEEGSL